jgi:hypothetical protein
VGEGYGGVQALGAGEAQDAGGAGRLNVVLLTRDWAAPVCAAGAGAGGTLVSSAVMLFRLSKAGPPSGSASHLTLRSDALFLD